MRAELRGVPEHLRQRHDGRDHLGSGALLEAVILPRRDVEIADDLAHVLLGRDHLDLHERLEEDRTLALLAASWNAIEPATLKAISEESTSWYEPSSSDDRDAGHREAARTPCSMASRIPWSTGLMNSLGIVPPAISFTNS